MPAPVDLAVLTGDAAGDQLDELSRLYAEVYAEPPYGWGPEHLALFRERFAAQRQQPGFTLVTARHDGALVGVGFGVTLQPSTPWWQNLLAPLPDDVTREHPGRTFAVVELLVHPSWRRRHVATAIHDRLLRHRPEQRATLTVLPDAAPARAAYRTWGWRKVAQKRNPLPGAPVFDVMLRTLSKPRSTSP